MMGCRSTLILEQAILSDLDKISSIFINIKQTFNKRLSEFKNYLNVMYPQEVITLVLF